MCGLGGSTHPPVLLATDRMITQRYRTTADRDSNTMNTDEEKLRCTVSN